MPKNDVIVCAGLSCLDLQLLGCTQSGSGEESIERYDRASYCAGGSSSMTATTLGLLLAADRASAAVGAEEEEEGATKTETTRTTTEVHVLTKLGSDLDGERMLGFYASAGADPSLTLVDPTARTSMAVLPVFTDGRRGCFVNLACNDSFAADELLGRLDVLSGGGSQEKAVRAFLFGYPHLMPKMQGEELRRMLSSARDKLTTMASADGAASKHSPLVGVDLNGVTPGNHSPSLLGPALGEIDVLHLNEEEAAIICGSGDEGGEGGANSSSPPSYDTSALHESGVAVVLLSLGARGCRISVTSDAGRLKQCPGRLSSWEPGTVVRVPAYSIDVGGDGGGGGGGGGEVNANGAGDALFASFCLASTWPNEGDVSVGPREAGTFAALAARQRCDVRTRDGGDGSGMEGSEALMARVKIGDLPETISC